MSARDDGGPAFPMQDAQAIHAYALARVQGLGPGEDRDAPYIKARAEAVGGMSLRDYFIAHAPAEPQPWFTPTVPPRPVMPSWEHLPDGPLRDEARALHYEEIIDPQTPEGERWVESQREAYEAIEAWQRDKDRARYVQWPAAWADAMLEERAKR